MDKATEYELKTSPLPEYEHLYEGIRRLHAQLIESADSDDAQLVRRANIEADRYLMEHKDVLIPLLLKSLESQIRGVRTSYEQQLNIYDDMMYASARITMAEDTYNSEIQQPKPPLLTRLLKKFNKGMPAVQYATEDNSVTALPGCTVKLKDGRYGLVMEKHSDGTLEVKGSVGLFMTNDEELAIVLAPTNRRAK